MIRWLATIGDGWYGVGHAPGTVAPQVARLRELLAEAGRADAPFEITVSTSAAALDREVLARFADAGVHRVVALPWTRPREAEDALRRFADAVVR